jgi:hypothetical protein
MMQRISGWCAFLGWLVIPGFSLWLVLVLPRGLWPLWILDLYLATAGAIFLAGAACGIHVWRFRRLGWGSAISLVLCLAGLLLVTSGTALGFRSSVYYSSLDGFELGSLAGPAKVAFAASSPPHLSDDRVEVMVEKTWLWHHRWGKSGYADATGALVIPLRFEGGLPFIGGLAKVYQGDREGIIDRQGEWVIPPRKEYLGYKFSEGKLPAVRGGRWGFLDTSNRWAIEPRFESASSFSEGLAGVRLQGKWGFVDGSDRLAIEPRFEEVGQFTEGLAAACFSKVVYAREGIPAVFRPHGGDWGYINREGSVAIEPRFSDVHAFHDGKAGVRLSRWSPVVFIDRSGQVLEEEGR